MLQERFWKDLPWGSAPKVSLRFKNLPALSEITLYLLSQFLHSSKNAFHSFLCSGPVFNLAKREARPGSTCPRVMQQFFSVCAQPCPWIHFVWSAAISQPGCTPGQAGNEQSQWKIMSLSSKMPGSLATDRDVPGTPAQVRTLCEGGSEVTVTFRKITSCVFISVGVYSRAEIACVVPQPKKGKRN